MGRKKGKIIEMFFRYAILIFFGVFSSITYFIFSYLTIWPSYFLLNLFYSVSISGDVLKVSGVAISIISACVAGSAYYLLLILNLTTHMNAKQRFYSLFFSMGLFLIINILRIVFFSVLLVENYLYFELMHRLVWYLMSIFLVIAIWFLTDYLFKIKNLPVYSDIKAILNLRKK
jgi:exosortase/archaeosortase family protein